MNSKQNNSNFLMGLLALSVSFPIIVVCSAWFFPGTELWGHFLENLLPELIVSTLILLLGVGLGVSILGNRSGIFGGHG